MQRTHDNDTVIITNPDSLIGTESDRLREATRKLDQAESTYAANVTNSPLARGSDTDHIVAELDRMHRPALEQAQHDALRAAESIHANARAVFHQTQHTEYTLSDTDMAAANARREFIRDDVASLSYGRLVDAVRFAVAKGDKPAMYVYAREIPKRLNRDRDNPDWSTATAAGEQDALRRLLTAIDDALRDRSMEPLNKRASDLMIRASDLRNRIEKPRMLERTYAFQSTGEVAW